MFVKNDHNYTLEENHYCQTQINLVDIDGCSRTDSEKFRLVSALFKTVLKFHELY
jgi:hypothetical protein